MSEINPQIARRLKGLDAIELHSRGCICRGTGWLSAPGIGRKASECPAYGREVILLPASDYVRLGRPKNIEEYEMAHEMAVEHHRDLETEESRRAALATGKPDKEKRHPMAMEMMVAAVSTGHEGTIRLAAQLAGLSPCPECGFVKEHCRCAAEKPEGT